MDKRTKNAAADTARCIPLPTPYPVGRVNTYLIDGDMPLLIDSGVNTNRSFEELVTALATVNMGIEDIAAVLITHRHFDHAGAAPELSRRAQVPIYCHSDSLLEEAKGREIFLDLIERYGAPASTLRGLESTWKLGDRFGQPLAESQEIRLVDEGEQLSFGDTALTAVHSPGHCPGHLCFVFDERGTLICGDLLLAQITANPLPHFDNQTPRGRLTSLALYLDSLKKVEKLGTLHGLPGHGQPIEDTAAAAATARNHILKRSDKVLRLMKRWDGRKLFDIAGKFFWEDSVVGQALAFCEILAHADLLEDRGDLEVDPDNGVVHLLRNQP